MDDKQNKPTISTESTHNPGNDENNDIESQTEKNQVAGDSITSKDIEPNFSTSDLEKPVERGAAQTQNEALMPNKSSIASVPGELGAKPLFGYDIPKTPPPRPKGKFPKILIVVPVIIAVISLIVLSVVKFVNSRGNTGLVGKKGEIHWWSYEDKALYQPLIDEYEQSNPGVKVIYEKQSTIDYRERLTNALEKGEGPDIFFIHNSWVPMYKSHVSQLPNSVMSKAEFSSSFFPVIVNNLTLQGNIVGMPIEYDAVTLFINEDHFSLAVKLPPQTWDEFIDIAVDLTQKTKEGIVLQSGAAMGYTDNIDYWPEIIALMMYQNGANPATPGANNFASEALSYYKLFNSGNNQTWSSILPNSTQAFAEGKVAMYFGPVRAASEIKKLSPNLRFKTVPVPQLPKDDPNAPNVSYASYWFNGVWSRSTNSEEAWKFLKFLSTSDSLLKLHQTAVGLGYLGKPYPRADMTELLIDDSYAGSILFLAQNAKSWYLAGNTFDGENGINSQIAKVYADVLSKGNISANKLSEHAPQLNSILTSFDAPR
jgi:ABC-type glycerol-3-phosphate transport system substrate-binding protein